MRWHEVKRKVRVHWRNRWIRSATAILILSLTVSLQYYLAKIPQPVNVEATGSKYTPATSRVTQQELVIYDPVINSQEEPLLSFDGRKNQTVEFHCAKAQLSSDTFSFLNELVQGQHRPPPADFERIDYFVRENDRKHLINNQTFADRDKEDRNKDADSSENDTCRMFIRVYTINNELPTEIHFYQPEPGTEHFRPIEVTAKGANLAVYLKQKNPQSEKEEGDPWASGCGKILQVKDWSLPNNGEFDLMIIVPANSPFRFDFLTTNDQATLGAGQKLFEPFRIGNQSLQAKSISVNTSRSDPTNSTLAPPIFEVHSTKNRGLLSINQIKVGEEELQLSFSGIGLIRTNGEDIKTLSFFELISQYPIVAGLFGLANAALLGWLIRSVFGKLEQRS